MSLSLVSYEVCLFQEERDYYVCMSQTFCLCVISYPCTLWNPIIWSMSSNFIHVEVFIIHIVTFTTIVIFIREIHFHFNNRFHEHCLCRMIHFCHLYMIQFVCIYIGERFRPQGLNTYRQRCTKGILLFPLNVKVRILKNLHISYFYKFIL